MTCVSGHLTDADFDADHQKWNNYPPEALFDAPVYVKVDQVCDPVNVVQSLLLQVHRIKERLPQTSNPKPWVPERCSYGLIVI